MVGDEDARIDQLPEKRIIDRPPPLVVFLFTVVMGALLVFVVVGPSPGADLVGNMSSRALALLVFGVLLISYSIWRYYLPQWTSRRSTAVWPLPEYQVDILQKSAGSNGPHGLERTGQAQLQAFVFALISPENVRQRITERYTAGQQVLVQRVTIEGQLPERYVRRIFAEASELERASDRPDRPAIPFPIMVPQKGELIDDLRVTASDGSELPVMSYRQYLQLVARSLRTLLDIAYGGDLGDGTHHEAFAAERKALRGILRRRASVQADRGGAREILRLAGKGGSSGPELPNVPACEMAAKMVAKLSSRYAIVAIVPCASDGRFVVSYERVMTPKLELAHRKDGWLNWIKARLRLALGVRPAEVTIDLENAPTAQSYHLVVDGGEGVFVGWQESPGLEKYVSAHARARRDMYERNLNAEPPPPPPYFRFRRRDGQTYAHFYTRFFPHPKREVANGSQIPRVRFRFFEVPPGSVFRAAVTAIAAAILIWIISLVTASSSPDGPATDAPAYLLVFPAVAAGFLGYESHQRRLLNGTLGAQQSLVLTALFSIAASGLFLASRVHAGILDFVNPFGVKVVGVSSLAWSALMIGSLLNALSVTYMALARTWEYIYLSRQGPRSSALAPHPTD